MKRNDIIRLLRSHGFILWKAGTKHDFWKRDGIIIPVSKGNSSNFRIQKYIRTVLRKFE